MYQHRLRTFTILRTARFLVRLQAVNIQFPRDTCRTVDAACVVPSGTDVRLAVCNSRNGELDSVARSVSAHHRTVPEFGCEIRRIVGMQNGWAASR